MQTRLLLATTIDATIEAFLTPLADHFRALGWRVDGAAARISTNTKAAPHFDQVWDMDWSQRPLGRNNVRAYSEIRRIVEQQGYDIVHVHTPVASFVTRMALRDLRAAGATTAGAGAGAAGAAGPKIVYTAHGFHCHPGGSKLSNGVFCALERMAGSWTDALVVINHEDERLARRYRLAGDGRIYYMPGIGVDLDQYSRPSVTPAAAASVRRELGLGPDDTLFLMIAAFAPGKRHPDALRAFRAMWRPGIHLALAGTGPEMERIEALAAELGLADHVHFLGFRDDVPELLVASSALILTSEREGLPRSVMEAMAMGTPVIGTRIRGTSELLAGGAGQLVDVGDVDALAAAMRLMVDDPAAAQACVERAHSRISRYALPRVVRLHQEMYQDLLGSR
jgi:glycosyltransferase involved in cell wall biosynthesis